jgi:hypothetical protein
MTLDSHVFARVLSLIVTALDYTSQRYRGRKEVQNRRIAFMAKHSSQFQHQSLPPGLNQFYLAGMRYCHLAFYTGHETL